MKHLLFTQADDNTAPQSGGSGARRAAAGAPTPAAASAPPAWLPIDQAPLGMPVRVRAGEVEEIGIRDPYVGWFNEARSGVLAITPTEFQPL